MRNMLAQAIMIATQAFVDKLDKSGKPYILHCLRVMNNVEDDEELKIIAVLHDLIEDTDMTINDLRNLNYSNRVLQALELLTHEAYVDYDVYIKLISNNKDATKVKLADLKDNLDPTRLKGLTKKDHERIEKYHRSFVYLSKT